MSITEDVPPREILLFLASGFDDLEAVAILEVCGWTAYRPHLAPVRVVTAGFHREVRGRFGTTFRVDLLVDEIAQPVRFAALALPGGFDSHGYQEVYDARLYAFARAIHANGGPIATMCVGALPIAEAGLLQGRRATTYAFSRSQDRRARLSELGALTTSGPIEFDGGVISCSGPAHAVQAALVLMEQLVGRETAEEIRGFLHC